MLEQKQLIRTCVLKKVLEALQVCIPKQAISEASLKKFEVYREMVSEINLEVIIYGIFEESKEKHLEKSEKEFLRNM